MLRRRWLGWFVRWPVRERSGGEPAFEGLMEAFDFPLGLWVAWCPVLLVDVVGF